GDRLEFPHQVLDSLREAAQRDRHRLLAARNVELHLDRRFQAAQELFRARGEGLDLAFRQVELHRLERHQVVGRHQDQEQGDQAHRRVDQRLVLFHERLHRLRSTMLVAKSEKPITDRKYARSRLSITPFWKPSKWVTTENAATVSMNAGLAQRTSRSVTGLKPARIRNRQETTDRMKATTWLRVIAEVMQVSARYAPARNRLPRYPAKIMPLSGLPRTLAVTTTGKVRPSAMAMKIQEAKNLPRIACQG